MATTSSATPRIVGFRSHERLVVRITTVVRLALVGLFIGNLGRIPVFSTGERDAPILLNDLLVALVLGVGVLQWVSRRSLRLDGLAVLALLFAAIGGASTLLSIPRFGLTAFETLVSLSYLARWLFYFGLYVVLINALQSRDVDALWDTLEWLILAFAIFGIIQSLTMPNFAQLVYPSSRPRADWDPQGHRLVSTWLDPVFAGAFIMLGLLVELAQLSVGRRLPVWKPGVLAIAMLLTASRAAILAAIVGTIVIVLGRGLSKRLLRVSAGLGLLSAVALPAIIWFTGQTNKLNGVNESALQRYVAWSRGLHVFLENATIGIGFNAWGFVQEHYGYQRLYVFSYSLDGGLIFVALMTGVLGLTAYVAMLIVTMLRARHVWRDERASASHRGLALGIAAGTVALVIDSLFGNSLFLPFLMETMWVLWALVFVLDRATGQRQCFVATT
jgi:hypothetical protein